MSQIKIDIDKAINKWKPLLESMGVVSEDRRAWMSEYAELHSIHENAYSNMGSFTGMGNVISAQPSTLPGQTIGGYKTGDAFGTNGLVGSGDYGQQLLPVAMKIAAQTIGLELVPVKPTSGPKIDLMYIDFEYDNTEDTADATARPIVFQLTLDTADLTTVSTYLKSLMVTTGTTETVGGLTKRLYVKVGSGNTVTASELTTVPSNKASWLEFLGFSRVNANPMFRVFRQPNVIAGPSSFASWSFDATKNTFAQTGSMKDLLVTGFAQVTGGTGGTVSALTLSNTASVSPEMISVFEDHIPGFVTNFLGGNKQADYPMSRLQSENSYPNSIGPKVTTKTIQVGEVEVSTSLKRTEIEDIKSSLGIDIVQKMESVLVNELSQTTSKQIINKLFEMGDMNRLSAPAQVTTNITDGKIFDFDVTAYLSTGAPGGETSHAIQRKLVSKVLMASNYLATEGRVGPASFIVCNGKYAAVIQDIIGYTVNPVFAKAKMNAMGQLYPVGQLGDITIYVDPYMKYNDDRILVGRKNAADQPGIVFIPYLMAQNVSLISEATFAPRMLLRSRYAIGELGYYPQKQYMTIKVYDANGNLM